ncbi:MAG: hypothetical protein ACXAD7_08585 [Candidatus Kariarchaeaceae archaeon]|jgi:hypothetical protein
MKDLGIYDYLFLSYFAIGGFIVYGIEFVLLALALFGISLVVRK